MKLGVFISGHNGRTGASLKNEEMAGA